MASKILGFISQKVEAVSPSETQRRWNKMGSD
jgi:hypothetical protein